MHDILPQPKQPQDPSIHITEQVQGQAISQPTSTSIPVHPNSSIFQDVIGIDHDPHSATVTVRLKPDGRCTRPFLRGRLSGLAILPIDNWEYERRPSEHVLIGSYQAPPLIFLGDNWKENGFSDDDNALLLYYLDIIVVFCHDFLREPVSDLETVETTIHASDVWNNTYDFSKTCTEPASQRKLTNPHTTVTVVSITNGTASGVIPGYWVHKHVHNHSVLSPMPIIQALETRYQPTGCYRNPSPECNPPITSVEPFQFYEFQWNINPSADHGIASTTGTSTTKPQLFFPQQLSSTPATTVCLLGSSHARKMVDYWQVAQTQWNLTNPTVLYHDVRMPYQVTVPTIQTLLTSRGCQRFVISVGQWPPGKRFRINANSPMQFQQLYQGYRTMLVDLHAAFPDVPFFVRSINYNPLGGLIGDCPPTDWRNPAVMDGYNAVIRHVVEEINSPMVSFIDTNFMVGPVWDAASDWCHLDEWVGLPQAMYVVSQAVR